MGRETNRLSARAAQAITEPGRHADGGNLYLSVSPSGVRKWVFLYRWQGRQREMGLGSAAKGQVSLAIAREIAANARNVLNGGRDPLVVKHEVAPDLPRIPTFGEAADAFIDAREPSWRNSKHVAQWRMTLKTYAARIRPLAVDKITTDDVLRVLQPLWLTKPETAGRLRGRIEAVLDAAKAKKQRTGENPALWRGNLAHLLTRRAKLTRGHHAALPYKDTKTFMGALRDREAIAALALEFTILTVARSGESLGARWPEIDVHEAVWTVPKERMKAGEEHRVPLSARAVSILKLVHPFADPKSDYVFPGQGSGKPLSNMAMAKVLERMGYSHVTVHGFRSTFSDWVSDCTEFSDETCEQALAHTIQNKAKKAYKRSDQFRKRRALMAAWAKFCEPAAQRRGVSEEGVARAA